MIGLVLLGLVVAAIAGKLVVDYRTFNDLVRTVDGRRAGGSRILGAGFDLELIGVGWRVEVPGARLGQRVHITMTPASLLALGGGRTVTSLGEATGPQRAPTGYDDVDRLFTVVSPDPHLVSAAFGLTELRAAVVALHNVAHVKRIDMTEAGSLVVILDPRRKQDGRAVVDAVLDLARACAAAAAVEVRASAGLALDEGVGAGSGLPVGMRIR